MRRLGRIKGLALAAVVALGSALSGAPAGASSLADALAAAYRNSNLLEQNRALLRATDEGVEQALAALGPSVDFVVQALANSQSAPDLMAMASLRASMTLADFGRGALSVEAAQTQVQATRAALVSVEQSVLSAAVRAYLGMFLNTQTVQLQRNNLRVIGEQRRAAQQRFELGDSTRTDIALAEARLAAARLALTAAEGDMAVSREEYNLAVGTYPGALSTPPSLPRLPATLSDAQTVARQHHPAIRQAQHQVAFADLTHDIAGLARYGTITGSVEAQLRQSSTSGFTSRTDNLSASITWGVPLYTSGRLSSVEREALARAQAARAALHQQVALVEQAVASAWARLAVARVQLSTSDLQIDATQAALDAVSAEAELGSRTTLDVLDAEQDLMDARMARVQATVGVHLAAYTLLESMGRLTVEALNLGVPTYDVGANTEALRAVRSPFVPSEQGRRLDRIMSRYDRMGERDP